MKYSFYHPKVWAQRSPRGKPALGHLCLPYRSQQRHNIGEYHDHQDMKQRQIWHRNDDIYIMVECLSVCLSVTKAIISHRTEKRCPEIGETTFLLFLDTSVLPIFTIILSQQEVCFILPVNWNHCCHYQHLQRQNHQHCQSFDFVS